MATTTLGFIPFRILQSTSLLLPMVSIVGLTLSKGRVSQDGNNATSPCFIDLDKSRTICLDSSSVVVTTSAGDLPPCATYALITKLLAFSEMTKSLFRKLAICSRIGWFPNSCMDLSKIAIELIHSFLISVREKAFNSFN